MHGGEVLHQKAQAFFEDLWAGGDPWELESSAFEQAKYARQLELLGGRRAERVLEIGCGAGCFSRLLASTARHVLALDISPTAIARARASGTDLGSVDFRVANIMGYDPHTEGPWDLVVMSETIYYLGWLYSFFDVAWLAAQLFGATKVGGRFLMANTYGGGDDFILRPWVIRTYRDLFLNVGYEVEVEELFRGTKRGAALEAEISVFTKGTENTRRADTGEMM